MTKSLPAFAIAFVLTLCNVVCADSVVQTETVVFNEANLPEEDVFQFPVFDDSPFISTFEPFGPSLGTLVSATVSFTDFSISVVGTGLERGESTEVRTPSIGFNISGPYTVGGDSFNGAGNSDFLLGLEGEPLEFELTLSDITQTFFTADVGLSNDDPNLVGESFNPAIFNTITGSVPFDVEYDTFGLLSLNDITDVVVDASVTISVQYDFEPAAVPEPSSFLVGALGLVAMTIRRRRG